MRKGPLPELSGGSGTTRGERLSDAVPTGEPSAHHARMSDGVPTTWVDRLLLASLELPLAEGECAVVERMVDALAEILPGHAVGACFVPEPGVNLGEQLLFKRLPEGVVEAPAGIDPTRVFPCLPHEHVVAVWGSTRGSTLHVASDDDRLQPDASPAVHLVDRAAIALGHALGHARRIASLASARRDVQVIEERLIQADKLATFGQIAAGVVHELNNPLTSIVAYSDYLIRKALGGAPAPDGDGADDIERLRRISESANRMLRFTRDLMSYARPSTSATGPVVLQSVIDQAVAFCEHILAGAHMRVERQYGPDVLMVRGVSEQLVQVFVNLLTNASQAAPDGGGRVSIGTSVDPGARLVRIQVQDDGPGIQPENVSQVFAPFFTTKGDRHGTGLGLSIVKSIILAHDGNIHVDSDPGSGARFVIELPAWQRT
jgi:two-component system, NtrC family, sensor kinase